MRVFGVVLSVMTLLMIITALSKMWLYIGTYGLSQLRLFTSVFMVVLGLVAVALTIWHIRAFPVSGVIVVLPVVALLGLAWANTDSLIAHYNVDLYLSERSEIIDVDYLDYLEVAAVPALTDLVEQATDRQVGADASEALSNVRVYNVPFESADRVGWMSRNLQAELAIAEMREQ